MRLAHLLPPKLWHGDKAAVIIGVIKILSLLRGLIRGLIIGWPDFTKVESGWKVNEQGFYFLKFDKIPEKLLSSIRIYLSKFELSDEEQIRNTELGQAQL